MEDDVDDEAARANDAGWLAVRRAYASARELLRRAEADATAIRADADRYRRQREQEAELLVARARRLLSIAEGRAATVAAAGASDGCAVTPPAGAVSTAPASGGQVAVTSAPVRAEPTVVLDLDRAASEQAWDLEPPLLVPDDAPAVGGSLRARSDLDSIVAKAVANAVDRALPTDR